MLLFTTKDLINFVYCPYAFEWSTNITVLKTEPNLTYENVFQVAKVTKSFNNIGIFGVLFQ